MNPSSQVYPNHIRPLTELDEARRAQSAGERLDQIRRAAPRLKDRIIASGQVGCVRSFDLQDLPYPTRYAFAGAASSPLPFIVMTNRANVIQFETDEGPRTLLFNPTDVLRSAETPFFAELRRRSGKRLADKMMQILRKPSPVEHLMKLGVAPEEVDYVAFDHLHTQDLRGILGSAEPGQRPVLGAFPNARLLVWRPELETVKALHPLQLMWYLRDCIRGIAANRMLPVDGDVLLGRGVALVRTPGHTVGNWSLVLSTERGVWAISENGVACDSYAPESSAVPGLRKYARSEGVEVILNSNTLEGRNEQYTSMLLERALVDRVPDNPDFYQHVASSELLGTPLTPGLSPTYRHGRLEAGSLRVRANGLGVQTSIKMESRSGSSALG